MSRHRPRAPRWAAWVALVGALACADTVRVETAPALRGRALSLERAAVAPFVARPFLGEPPLREDAPALVTRYVTDALAQRGVAVVPPGDVAVVLPAGPLDPVAAAAAVNAEFGADALVVGSVIRFRERRGESLGSERPASAHFRVELYSAPDGSLLWRGHFEETQEALSENVLKTTQYPGGGLRWLTVEEFARWGAQEVVASMPLAP